MAQTADRRAPRERRLDRPHLSDFFEHGIWGSRPGARLIIVDDERDGATRSCS